MRSMTLIGIPERTEASEYYFNYIDRITSGDILSVLEVDIGLRSILRRLRTPVKCFATHSQTGRFLAVTDGGRPVVGARRDTPSTQRKRQ